MKSYLLSLSLPLLLLAVHVHTFTCPASTPPAYEPACCDTVSECTYGHFEGSNCFEAFPFPEGTTDEFTCILHDEEFGDSLQGVRACCRDVVNVTAQCVETVGGDV